MGTGPKIEPDDSAQPREGKTGLRGETVYIYEGKLYTLRGKMLQAHIYLSVPHMCTYAHTHRYCVCMRMWFSQKCRSCRYHTVLARSVQGFLELRLVTGSAPDLRISGPIDIVATAVPVFPKRAVPGGKARSGHATTKAGRSRSRSCRATAGTRAGAGAPHGGSTSR